LGVFEVAKVTVTSILPNDNVRLPRPGRNLVVSLEPNGVHSSVLGGVPGESEVVPPHPEGGLEGDGAAHEVDFADPVDLELDLDLDGGLGAVGVEVLRRLQGVVNSENVIVQLKFVLRKSFLPVQSKRIS